MWRWAQFFVRLVATSFSHLSELGLDEGATLVHLHLGGESNCNERGNFSHPFNIELKRGTRFWLSWQPVIKFIQGNLNALILLFSGVLFIPLVVESRMHQFASLG